MPTSHQPFDETAKAFYQNLFKSWGIEVETEREVFSRSRKIDLVVHCLAQNFLLTFDHSYLFWVRNLVIKNELDIFFQNPIMGAIIFLTNR